jgi:hypothetical protein
VAHSGAGGATMPYMLDDSAKLIWMRLDGDSDGGLGS